MFSFIVRLVFCVYASFTVGLCAISTVPDASIALAKTSVDEDEIKIVEQLIATTEQRLKVQKQLRELMVTYQTEKEVFAQGNQTKPQVARLVRLGRSIYELIESNHFEHLFAKDYLDELQFFSSIAGKKTVTRP